MAGIHLHQITQPGQHAAGVGFEQPFEMLTACHERVHRMLRLLGKLREHLATRGHDEQAAQAARDVMRYFDQAAPLHHEDEELHVFPLLLQRGDEALRQAVRRLQADHVAMGEIWPRARRCLLAVADAAAPSAWAGWAPGDEQLLDRFAGQYDEHIRLEETLVYPAAQGLLDAPALSAIGEEMQHRRIDGKVRGR
jgi:hemerythrin-like domain-containing protein